MKAKKRKGEFELQALLDNWLENQDEFLKHYHMRSKIEIAFSEQERRGTNKDA